MLILLSGSAESDNLDLSVPDVHLPSTMPVYTRAVQDIKIGWLCCYNNSLVARAKTDLAIQQIGVQYQTEQNQIYYKFMPDTDRTDWILFYTIQALDVHSSIQGLKYSCITEANPFLPPVPHRDHLMLHKVALMFTIFKPEYWDIREINMLSMFTSYVVIENRRLTSKATCPLR